MGQYKFTWHITATRRVIVATPARMQWYCHHDWRKRFWNHFTHGFNVLTLLLLLSVSTNTDGSTSVGNTLHCIQQHHEWKVSYEALVSTEHSCKNDIQLYNTERTNTTKWQATYPREGVHVGSLMPASQTALVALAVSSNVLLVLETQLLNGLHDMVVAILLTHLLSAATIRSWMSGWESSAELATKSWIKSIPVVRVASSPVPVTLRAKKWR